MGRIIGQMYITMLPVILAGILNMVCVKQKWFKKYAKPLDRNAVLKDGKRIFGDNKTDFGIITMIICSVITHIIWGYICSVWSTGRELNQLYKVYENNICFNLALGWIMGVAYMIFELPNSFIKRRLEIPDGKTLNGVKGKIFMVVDQVDSLFGVIAVLAFVSPITIGEYFNYIILGGLTHITANWIMYKMKIRRNL